MTEPDFDAPAVGPRPPIRRLSAGQRPMRAPVYERENSRGFVAALIVGALLLIGIAGIVGWLVLESMRPSGPQFDVPGINIALPPPDPSDEPAEPQPSEPSAAEEKPAESAPAVPPQEAVQPPPTPTQPAPTTPPQASPAPAPQAIPAPPRAPDARVPMPTPDGLTPAPDIGLVERSPDGQLPTVGRDGRKPWQVYARPFDANDKRPRVALIIGGLGLSAASTEAAIQRLPGGVTLAFAPYARNLPQWVDLARAAGHETLLTVPMEPGDYPSNDPGPHTLLTTLGEAQNRARLNWLLARFTGYTGVMNLMGSRFTTDATALKPVLGDLERRGLLFVDARASLNSVAGKMAREIGLPTADNDRYIDTRAARDEIDRRLEELEQVARREGVALGIGAPYPVTLERVARWVQELDEKGIALAPVSAVVNRQKK